MSENRRNMTDWLGQQRKWLTVERLPGYAPELNPSEQVWGNLKSQELANLCADTIDTVAAYAVDGLQRITDDASLCSAFLRHARTTSMTLHSRQLHDPL